MNKISIRVSAEYKNMLMTKGLKLFLQSNPSRETNPPKFDEMFCKAVDLYVNGYVIQKKKIKFFKKFIPEMFPEEELEDLNG